jgi:DNA polymerase III epsilon subunit-like protein
MSWALQTIHFIDFEGSVTSGILEYGVVSLRGGEIVDTATRTCRATGRVRDEDVAVHGLVAERLAGDAPFSDEFERFVGLRESGPLAAHFAQAENSMMKSVWAYPRRSPDFLRDGPHVVDWGPWVDTGRLYPQLYPSVDSAKLGDLVVRCGLQYELDSLAERYCPADRRFYHAALYDALAGALLLMRLANEPTLAGQSLAWLLTTSTLDPDKRAAMTQGDLF